MALRESLLKRVQCPQNPRVVHFIVGAQQETAKLYPATPFLGQEMSEGLPNPALDHLYHF